MSPELRFRSTQDIFSCPVDMSAEFFALIPAGEDRLTNCAIKQTELEAMRYAQAAVEQDDSKKYYVLKCVAIVETEKKPVKVTRFGATVEEGK